jgi:type IX secretion system PorP/SprF family membrane protein
MKQPVILAIAFFAVAVCTLKAQDKHFTQFYASPMTLNPALSGLLEGRYRVNAIYRDQWRGILDAPIRSFSVAGDFRFDAPGRNVREDNIGLGLMFFNDEVGSVNFSTTQIAISLAYHKSLDINNRQYLSVGFQGGITQRNVNYESLRFQDQFNGFSGFDLPTGEALPENNFAYFDYNAGVNYTSKIGRNGGFFVGLAMHHFNRPRTDFFEVVNQQAKLYPKYSAQLAANIPFSEGRAAFLPRFLVASQGPHMEINTGGNLRFAMGRYGTSALHVGSWVRPVRNQGGMGVDAAVLLLGLEVNQVLFGVSYDLNLSALTANQRQGAFEISVAYLGSYENEGILCPKF